MYYYFFHILLVKTVIGQPRFKESKYRLNFSLEMQPKKKKKNVFIFNLQHLSLLEIS